MVFNFGVINERIDPKDSCKFENLFSSCSSKDQSKARAIANLFFSCSSKDQSKARAIANLFFSCSSKDQSKTFVGGIGLE
jgi:hypothetical protein